MSTDNEAPKRDHEKTTRLIGGQVVRRVLPGELTADEVLDGAYPFPPSSTVTVRYDDTGFARDRLSVVPPAGVHPRILLSPEDLPDLRHRIVTTNSGAAMIATLRGRVSETINLQGSWENRLFGLLVDGQIAESSALINECLPPSSQPGHYQPHVLYALVMEAFDTMIVNDTRRGRAIAAAVASYAAVVEDPLMRLVDGPLSDDVWRIKVAGPTTGA